MVGAFSGSATKANELNSWLTKCNSSRFIREKQVVKAVISELFSLASYLCKNRNKETKSDRLRVMKQLLGFSMKTLAI